MTPGEIVTRGDDLYVVLAVEAARAAVAPLVLAKRNRVMHAVPVRAGGLGDGYVMGAQACTQPGPWQFSGYCLTLGDLAACQMAVRRAVADKMVTQRYAPLCAFEQAKPRIMKNGGRRVGPKLAV